MITKHIHLQLLQTPSTQIGKKQNEIWNNSKIKSIFNKND